MNNKAKLFQIQKFSLHDGPGIRTTIFFKGCNISCPWCHNPESVSVKNDLAFDSRKCTDCQKCVIACQNSKIDDPRNIKFNKKICTNCLECVNSCCSGALTNFGYDIDIDSIYKDVIKDKKYFGKDGGVTFSGGEALMQSKYVEQLAIKFKNDNLHLALETNAFLDFSRYNWLLNSIDLFLIDYKINADSAKHIAADPKFYFDNLDLLCKKDKEIILRCPIIPTINDNEKHYDDIVNLLKKYPKIKTFEIMGYHNFGHDKWNNLQLDYSFALLPSMTKEEIKKISEYIENKLGRNDIG